MRYNYYVKNTGLDDCILVVAVIVIDCQASRKIVMGCMGNSLSSIHREDLFFILSGVQQKEGTNIIRENISNY